MIDKCVGGGGCEEESYKVIIIQEGYSVPHLDKVKMGSRSRTEYDVIVGVDQT